jgi:hypothetical protein
MMINWLALLIELPICLIICTLVDYLELPFIPVITLCFILIMTGILILKKKNANTKT